jgi:hypothetical protein
MKNAVMSFAGKWVEMEIIMLSHLSQIWKDKYHVFCHIPRLDLRIKRHEQKGGAVLGKPTGGRQDKMSVCV